MRASFALQCLLIFAASLALAFQDTVVPETPFLVDDITGPPSTSLAAVEEQNGSKESSRAKGIELVQGAAGALNPWCIVPQQENLLENVICIIIICIAILLETGHHYVQQKLENYRTGLDLRSQYGQVDAVDYSDLDEGLLSGGKHFLIFFFGSQAS